MTTRGLADRRCAGDQVVGRDLRAPVSVRFCDGLLLEGLDLFQQGRDTRSPACAGGTLRAAATSASISSSWRISSRRRLAGERGDPPGARRHRLLADDLEQAHLADVVQVRAAAELARELAHPDDADVFGVFLAEERHRAERLLASSIGIRVHDTGAPVEDPLH